MPSTTLLGRLSVAALTTGVLAGVLVPLTANAATATCPTYVDPEGDASPPSDTSTPLQDDGLDVLAVTHSTAGGVFSSTVKTVQLLESGSDNSFGDWFQVGFTVVGKAVTVRVVRDANITGTTTTRLQVDEVTAEALPEAVYDFKAATVTLKVKQADLEKAVNAKLDGKPFAEMETLSYGNYAGRGLLFDTAVGDEKTSYVFGTACKGAAAGPAPKPAASSSAASAAPSGSPAPSGSASPRPTASPGASGSASPAASAGASASPAPPQPTVPVPARGCVGFADPQGDGRPGNAQAPNDPTLDILAVTGRTEPTAIAGHLQVDRLAGRPSLAVFSGYRFEYQFTVSGKVVLLRGTTTGPGTASVDGTAMPDVKVTAAFDTVSNQVVLSADRPSLAKAVGRELPNGTFLEGVTARSTALAPGVAFAADTATAEDAARGRYTVGDSTCFAPKISAALPAEVQTSDRAVVSVSMTTSDGRTAAGQTVTARVGNGRAVSARTNTQGNATLIVPVTDAAGSRLLVVRSTGSAGKGELTSEVRVLTERSVLRLLARGTGAARTVTATLTDDDDRRRPLAGQRIVFKVGGRSVAVTTDSAGRASTTAPKGSVVEATFAGRRGFLTAATARARS